MHRKKIWLLVIIVCIGVVIQWIPGEKSPKKDIINNHAKEEWSKLVQSSREGDLLFFAQRKQCGEGCENNSQFNHVSYGYFSHVALIYLKSDENITVLHSASREEGIKTSDYSYDYLKRLKYYETISLFRVKGMGDKTAKMMMQKAFKKYKGGNYASPLEILNEVYTISTDTHSINTCSGFAIKVLEEYVDLTDVGKAQNNMYTPDSIATSTQLTPMESVDFFH